MLAGVPPWGLAAVVPPLPVVSGPVRPCGEGCPLSSSGELALLWMG
jgi:hypothetical protein